MKKLSKLILTILIVAVLLVLTACGDTVPYGPY